MTVPTGWKSPNHVQQNGMAPPLVLSAVLIAALAGCGDGAEKRPDANAVSLVKAANARTLHESFHSSGTTTAFAGDRRPSDSGLRYFLVGSAAFRPRRSRMRSIMDSSKRRTGS
ncbi:hypothetical protein Slala05_27930 [Streptomyces lavendulae subsp. lavendulae]|nr:hypothetical protein Slala05_27930 [Streptomyces lavendulae subsp. lavendulae]